MALGLPLELQQQIFGYLDAPSFYASRNVCRWWNLASRDSTTLANQLRRLPIQPAASASTTNNSRLQSLYNEAAHILMLGMQANAHDDNNPNLSQKLNKPKLAISADGHRAVTLDARKITLHDLTSSSSPILSQRPLNDLRTAIGGGPWFKCAPTSIYELALSSTGTLLAIALERTIQIYDLSASDDSWPVASYISSASGHFIAGLSFQHNDSILRVQLSNKGTVLYLGSPKQEAVGLEHWASRGGLKHAYLDTSKMVVRSATPERLAGLQLLRPFADGWLFAAQKYVTGTAATAASASSYCLGHVRGSESASGVSTIANEAVVLLTLPSKHSSCLTGLELEERFRTLPKANEGPPTFAASSDGTLLALVEAGTKDKYIASASNGFVYRLLGEVELERLLERSKRNGDGHKDGVLEQNGYGGEDFTIHRVPLSLGDTRGKILDFDFEEDETDGYALKLVTELETRRWEMQERML